MSEENRIVGPIEEPSSSSGLQQPRPPRNLQDLLRYSVEANTQNNVQQPSSSYQPLAPDRRRFLEEALSSMTVDVVKELSDSLNILSTINSDNLNEENLAMSESALDTISVHVDCIDFANDFVKLNGFKVMKECLKCKESSIRWRAADIIAVCTQNNPTCQKNAVEQQFLKPLMNIAEADTDSQSKIKAFYAISCIVRDSDIGLSQFMTLDGFSFLLRAMQSDCEKIRTKACFLLSALTSNDPKIKSELCKMGFVEQLIALIQGEHSSSHEHMISALLSLVTDHENAQSECRRPELRLQPYLLGLIKDYRGDATFEEEIYNAEQILKIIFTSDSDEER